MAGSRTTGVRVLLSAESFLPATNGVTNSVLRVCDHLLDNGHEVLVVAPGEGPDRARTRSGHEARVERVRSVGVPRYGSLDVGLTGVAGIARIAERYDPDVVHLAAPVALGRSVGRWAEQAGVPTVALFQTDLSGFVADYGFGAATGGIWRWLRRIHNRADLTLAPTPTVARGIEARGFERVAVWGRGVDHAQFDPGRRSERFRAACGADQNPERPEGRLLVGYIGRLAAEKRIDGLRALLDDPDLAPRVAVVVVGDGPERERLERLLPEAHFAGFRSGDELGEAMASLDVFVHTGPHETFCQTVQEAMAAGVAVVAPAAGGPVDLIDHGENGLLYGGNDWDDLTRQVRLLTADPTLRRRLAVAGNRRVADRSWTAVGDELLDHYGQILERRPVRRRSRRRRPVEHAA